MDFYFRIRLIRLPERSGAEDLPGKDRKFCMYGWSKRKRLIMSIIIIVVVVALVATMVLAAFL